MSRGRWYISFTVIFTITHLPVLFDGHLVYIELGNAKRELMKVDSETSHLIVSQVSYYLSLCLVYLPSGITHFTPDMKYYLFHGHLRCFLKMIKLSWLTPFEELSLCDQLSSRSSVGVWLKLYCHSNKYFITLHENALKTTLMFLPYLSTIFSINNFSNILCSLLSCMFIKPIGRLC